MSLLNQHWNTPKEGVTTGRVPAQLRLMNDTPMSREQYAGVTHAYKLFVDALRVSLGGFLSRDRVLQDGTRVRLVSNFGVDTVMVWPVGGGQEGERFFGGIAVQFEKVTFDPDGENSADLSGQTIWVGSAQVIDAVKSLALPSNVPGTISRCTKENVLPEDLIIWVSPKATLSAASFEKGEVKIKRARVDRGAVTDSNFGESADRSRVTPRCLMSMDYGSVLAFYLGGRRLPFDPPPKEQDYAYPVFLLSLGFETQFKWSKNDLTGLLIIGVGLGGSTGLVKVFAADVKKGNIEEWVLVGSGTGVFEGDTRYQMTWEKTAVASTYTLRTPAALRGRRFDTATLKNDAHQRDVTIVLTVPNGTVNLSEISLDVTSVLDEAPEVPERTISYSNYIKYDVREFVLPDGRPYKICDLTVRRITTASGGVEAPTSHETLYEVKAQPAPYSYLSPYDNVTVLWAASFTADVIVSRTRTAGDFSITVFSEGENVAPVPVSGVISKQIRKDNIISDSYTGGAWVKNSSTYNQGGTPGSGSTPHAGTGVFSGFTIDVAVGLPFTPTQTTISADLVPAFSGPIYDSYSKPVEWQTITPNIDRGTDSEAANGVTPFFVIEPVISLMLPENISGEANIASWYSSVWDRHVSYEHSTLTTDGENFVSGPAHFGIYGPERRADTADTIRLEESGFNLVGADHTRDTVLTETSSFPAPEYIGPRTTDFIYDPRTRSFFLSATLDTERIPSGAGERAQQSVMVIGNGQGHTDFYPILNAWIAAEHAAAKDGITEVYGDGDADSKIIVGLNLKKPSLV